MNDTTEAAAMNAAYDRKVKTPAVGARASCGRFLFYSSIDHASFAVVVSRLRWVLPVLVGLIGTGYILLEQVALEGHSISSPHVIRGVIVIGVVGPIFPWLILSWTTKIAAAEAEAQRELALRNRGLAALNAVGEVTSQSLNLDHILRTALERTVELVGMESGQMRIVEGGRLVLRAHYRTSAAQDREKSVPLGECLCGRCVRTGKTLRINNLAALPSLADRPCAQEGFQSIISVPMETKGKVVGVMLLASRDRDRIALPDQRILTAIGYRMAATIENAQLYQQARRRAVHLETASLIGQRMISLLDLDPLLSEVVRMIKDKFGYQHAHIFLVEEESREIVLKQASGPGADTIKRRGLRLKIGEEGITGWVAHTGQTAVCNDVSREPRYHADELVPETQSESAVPLRVGNRIIGVLDVQSNQRDTFDKEDVTILQILGNQIGIAIRNAQLFQETKQRYAAMVALHEISLDMIAQLDTTQLLQALLRRGAQLLRAQAGSLFLYDADRELIYNAANYNTWQDWAGVVLHLGEGAVGRVIQSGRPLIENDYANWSGRAQVFAGSPQTRVISVPLKWENRIIGGLDIINDSQGRPFREDDIWLLTHFADLASIAVKNAELHTQVKEFSSSLELKVRQRTEELSRAKDEIMAKAEQLRSLLAKTIDLQETERARIARDMHDGVVQLISAVHFELQAAELLCRSNSTGAAEEKLATAQQDLSEMEKEIRRAIYDLHPAILDVVGLAPAVQKYIQRFEGLAGIRTELQVGGHPYRLPQAIEIAMFRLVQEALHNVSAHANADTASVVVDYGLQEFCVSVRDNGSGFDYRQWMEGHHNNHLGLFGMHERVEKLGGTMDVWSEPGQGTRVMFQLPIIQVEEAL